MIVILSLKGEKNVKKSFMVDLELSKSRDFRSECYRWSGFNPINKRLQLRSQWRTPSGSFCDLSTGCDLFFVRRSLHSPRSHRSWLPTTQVLPQESSSRSFLLHGKVLHEKWRKSLLIGEKISDILMNICNKQLFSIFFFLMEKDLTKVMSLVKSKTNEQWTLYHGIRWDLLYLFWKILECFSETLDTVRFVELLNSKNALCNLPFVLPVSFLCFHTSVGDSQSRKKILSLDGLKSRLWIDWTLFQLHSMKCRGTFEMIIK